MRYIITTGFIAAAFIAHFYRLEMYSGILFIAAAGFELMSLKLIRSRSIKSNLNIAGGEGAVANEQAIERIQRYINVTIAILGAVIACAVVWELFLPRSRIVEFAGLISFGILCVFLRGMPRRFLIPKPRE